MATARQSIRLPSERDEPELRFDAQIDLADRLEATLTHEAVMADRLRVAEEALQSTALVDAARSGHSVHEIDHLG
jgi:hypothetical protein